MIQIFTKIWTLFDAQERKKFILLLFIMLLMVVFELIGVGSVMPFLAVLGNPEIIDTNQYLSAIYIFFRFESKDSFLIFVGVSTFLTLVLGAIVRSLGHHAQWRFANMRRHALEQRLLKKYLHQPYTFFLSKNSNDISKTILSEVELTINQAMLPLLSLLTYGVVTIALVGALVIVDPVLALILGSTMGSIYGLIYVLTRKYLERISSQRAHANTQKFKTVSEVIGGIKELKVLGREQVYFDSFKKPSYEFSHYISRLQTISHVPQFMVEAVAFGALLAIAIYALARNEADIGTLLPVLGLYALATLRLKPAINNVYTAISAMKFGLSAVDTIINDLKETNDDMKTYRGHTKLPLTNKLVFKDVIYNYPNTSNLALQDINFSIKANTTVGIIGTTGAGKTTLVDMMLGLLQPRSGQIEIDHKALNKANIRQWQNAIGYVPQSIFLADDTIANNIAFGIEKNAINMAQVAKVAKMTQADEFISKLEKGYDTIIGERGVRLSGGQRQRLGIARALYHNPELLILDEATSALDNNTEAKVMQAIDGMTGSKTIIIIAHRLSTVERCDMIIELENGKVISNKIKEDR